MAGILIGFPQLSFTQDGKALFKQNCAACHKMGQRLVGPDLAGIESRRSEEWLIKFIRSSQTLINSGDQEAKAVFEDYNKLVMPDQPLNDDEIKAVLAYITENSPEDVQGVAQKIIQPRYPNNQ